MWLTLSCGVGSTLFAREGSTTQAEPGESLPSSTPPLQLSEPESARSVVPSQGETALPGSSSAVESPTDPAAVSPADVAPVSADTAPVPSDAAPAPMDVNTPRPERYPPPEGAFVVLLAELRAWDEGAVSAARGLSSAVGGVLHGRGTYHVVELRDLPDVTGRPAQDLWREAAITDIGRVSLLGDRARARLAITGWLEAGPSGIPQLRLRMVDLDFMEELPGVVVPLPSGYFVSELAPSGTQPASGLAVVRPEKRLVPVVDAPPTFPTEWVEGVALAIEAALIPRTMQIQATQRAAVTRVIEEEAESESGGLSPDAVLSRDLDALANKMPEPAPDGTTTNTDIPGYELDTSEQEVLGMTTDEYRAFKERQWTESEWRRRQKGRTGYVGGRLSFGQTWGRVDQLYDGVVLVGAAGTDVVEKYARLLPAAGEGGEGILGLTWGITPEVELEVRGGFIWAESIYRTQQAFVDQYPCEAGPQCPKLEGVSSPVWRLEMSGRYYLRRVWDVHPYLGIGAGIFRYADMVRAYNAEAVQSFPLNLFDPLPPVISFGVSGMAGVSWDINRYTAFFVEIPSWLRLVDATYEPLHYYATVPEVEDPPRPEGLPFTTSVQFGIHVRYK